MLTFQQLILQLNAFWDRAGLRAAAALRHGSGRGHLPHRDVPARDRPGALERGLRAAFAPAQGRPLRREPEPPAALLSVPGGAQALARRHPGALPRLAGRDLGIDPREHDIRFVEDDWESPTLGAWGLGWEVWLDGMEVTQFTYFQEVGSLVCKPVLGEITYGLERLAMYLQGKENVYDLVWTPGRDATATSTTRTRSSSRAITSSFPTRRCCSSTSANTRREAKRLMEAQLRAARLRDGDEVLAHVQPARRARRDLGNRARAYIGRVRALARWWRRLTTSRASGLASRCCNARQKAA